MAVARRKRPARKRRLCDEKTARRKGRQNPDPPEATGRPGR